MGPENENDTKGLTLHFLLCVVDAWNLFKKSSLSIEVQNEFYVNLFEEIIDESGIATCKTIDFQLNAKDIFG